MASIASVASSMNVVPVSDLKRCPKTYREVHLCKPQCGGCPHNVGTLRKPHCDTEAALRGKPWA